MAAQSTNATQTCLDVLKSLKQRTQPLQLDEAINHLKLYIEQQHIESHNFQILQDDIRSRISIIKMHISQTKACTSSTDNVFANICAIIEAQPIQDQSLYLMAIHFSLNTFNRFTTTKRIQCMEYIAKEFDNIEEVKDDLSLFDEYSNYCGIIDELDITTNEAKQWVIELNRAIIQLETIINLQSNKEQENKPTVYNTTPFNDDDDDEKITTMGDDQYISQETEINEPYIINYSKTDCKQIANVLLTVLFSNNHIQNDIYQSTLNFDVTDSEKTMNSALYECSPNMLLRVIDLIVRCQLKHVLKYQVLDRKLLEIINDFMMNIIGIKRLNLNKLDLKIARRIMNYVLPLTALCSETKLLESPKALQLILALSTRCEMEIMSAFKRINYDETAITIIEFFTFYKPKMMNIMEQQEMQNTDNHLILINAKDHNDPNFNNTEAFYQHIYGQIPAMITKYGEHKRLIRLFILLGNNDKKKTFAVYPRVMISIQSIDIGIKKRINNNKIYDKLIDIRSSIDFYPIVLEKKRYDVAIDIMTKELEKIMKPKKTKNPFKFIRGKINKYNLNKTMIDYDAKVSSIDNQIADKVENNCYMFSKIISPKKYKNEKIYFTQKMYQFYAGGMIRCKKDDIIEILPKLFENKSLILNRYQMDQILGGRDNKYGQDIEFEKYEDEFFDFAAKNNQKLNDNDDVGDIDEVQQDLHYQSSIISDIMEAEHKQLDDVILSEINQIVDGYWCKEKRTATGGGSNNKSSHQSSSNRCNRNNDENKKGNVYNNNNNRNDSNDSIGGFGAGNGGGDRDNDDDDDEKRNNRDWIKYDDDDDDDDDDEEEKEEKKEDIINRSNLNTNAPEFIPGQRYGAGTKLLSINETATVNIGYDGVFMFGYEPNTMYRAKGNIKIDAKLTKTILPNTIKEEFKNLYHFMDKSTALLFANKEYKEFKNMRVINYGFHDKITNVPLYCIMIKQNISNNLWKMKNELFTEQQLKYEYHINCRELPVSLEIYKPFISKLNDSNKVKKILNDKEFIQYIIKNTAWHKIPIKSRVYNKKRLTLSMTKEEFTKNLTNYVNDNDSHYNLVDILMFNAKTNEYRIECLWIIRIDCNTDIGISLVYNAEMDKINVCGIHLDKIFIINQHELINNNHDCHCLDNFISNINMLAIGNPDVDKNRVKDFRKKIDDLKKENINLKKENFKKIDILNKENVNLKRKNKENEHEIERLKKILTKYTNDNNNNNNNKLLIESTSTSNSPITPIQSHQNDHNISPQTMSAPQSPGHINFIQTLNQNGSISYILYQSVPSIHVNPNNMQT